MTRAMYMAVVFLMASAVVQASQCSSGSGCPSDNEPRSAVALLQTKLRMNVLENGREATTSPYCFVDDPVSAHWVAGSSWYNATITALKNDGGFTVKWDKDGSHTELAASNVKKGGVVCEQASASTEAPTTGASTTQASASTEAPTTGASTTQVSASTEAPTTGASTTQAFTSTMALTTGAPTTETTCEDQMETTKCQEHESNGECQDDHVRSQCLLTCGVCSEVRRGGLFSKIDANHDGNITRGEWARAPRWRGGRGAEANFTFVGYGWCASYGHWHSIYQTRASSLADCKLQCADNKECHAINYKAINIGASSVIQGKALKGDNQWEALRGDTTSTVTVMRLCEFFNRTFNETITDNERPEPVAECWNLQAPPPPPPPPTCANFMSNRECPRGTTLDSSVVCNIFTCSVEKCCKATTPTCANFACPAGSIPFPSSTLCPTSTCSVEDCCEPATTPTCASWFSFHPPGHLTCPQGTIPDMSALCSTSTCSVEDCCEAARPTCESWHNTYACPRGMIPDFMSLCSSSTCSWKECCKAPTTEAPTTEVPTTETSTTEEPCCKDASCTKDLCWDGKGRRQIGDDCCACPEAVANCGCFTCPRNKPVNNGKDCLGDETTCDIATCCEEAKPTCAAFKIMCPPDTIKDNTVECSTSICSVQECCKAEWSGTTNDSCSSIDADTTDEWCQAMCGPQGSCPTEWCFCTRPWKR